MRGFKWRLNDKTVIEALYNSMYVYIWWLWSLQWTLYFCFKWSPPVFCLLQATVLVEIKFSNFFAERVINLWNNLPAGQVYFGSFLPRDAERGYKIVCRLFLCP